MLNNKTVSNFWKHTFLKPHAVFLVLMGVFATNANADQFSVYVPYAEPNPQINNSPTAVTITRLVSGPVCTPSDCLSNFESSSIGRAFPGGVGTLSGVILNLLEYIPNTATVVAQNSYSIAKMDNLLLTGPAGTTGDTIPLSFNIALSGTFGANASGGLASLLNAGAGGSWDSFYGGAGFGLGELYADSSGGLTQTGIFSTIPRSGVGSGTATSPTFSTLVGDTFSVGFRMSSSAVATNNFGGGPGHADAFADFNNALGFSTTGPAFNLPAGYTVNSSDGLIVNNRFTGGAGTVPEPASLALLGIGLAGIALTRRRKNA